MARIEFRQGIVEYQRDTGGNPIFLNTSTIPNAIDLIVNPNVTRLNFADGEQDYLFEESVSVIGAWSNIPVAPTDAWIYWDINRNTGERTFGFTLLDPVSSVVEPANPAIDQHWFDLQRNIQRYWNGSSWVHVLRIFAAKVRGTTIIEPFPLGTQVGLSGQVVFAGHILFDDDNVSKPIKRFDRRGRGTFITTETPIISQFAKLASFKLESALIEAMAVETIPIYHCVAYKGPRELGLASNLTPNFPCVGISREGMVIGETRSFIISGNISDDNLIFNGNPGDPVFVGTTGAMVTTPPQFISLQVIGSIVDKHTVFINIEPVIHYEEV